MKNKRQPAAKKKLQGGGGARQTSDTKNAVSKLWMSKPLGKSSGSDIALFPVLTVYSIWYFAVRLLYSTFMLLSSCFALLLAAFVLCIILNGELASTLLKSLTCPSVGAHKVGINRACLRVIDGA